jgi:hypothetical protein
MGQLRASHGTTPELFDLTSEPRRVRLDGIVKYPCPWTSAAVDKTVAPYVSFIIVFWNPGCCDAVAKRGQDLERFEGGQSKREEETSSFFARDGTANKYLIT